MTSPQSNLSLQSAPRDLATLTRAGRYQLRNLAQQLGLYSGPDGGSAFAQAVTDEQARLVLEALNNYDRQNGGGPPQAPPQQQQQQNFQPPPPAQAQGFAPQGYQNGAPPQAAPQFAPPPQMTQNMQPPMPGPMQPGFAPQQQMQQPPPFTPPQQVQPGGFAAQGGFPAPAGPPQAMPPQAAPGYPAQNFQPPPGFGAQPPPQQQQPPMQQQPMFQAPQDQPAQAAPANGKMTRKPRGSKNADAAAPSAPATTTPAAAPQGGDSQVVMLLREVLDELENQRRKTEVLTGLVFVVLEGSFNGDVASFLQRVAEINPELQDGITRLVGKGPTKS